MVNGAVGRTGRVVKMEVALKSGAVLVPLQLLQMGATTAQGPALSMAIAMNAWKTLTDANTFVTTHRHIGTHVGVTVDTRLIQTTAISVSVSMSSRISDHQKQ